SICHGADMHIRYSCCQCHICQLICTSEPFSTNDPEELREVPEAPSILRNPSAFVVIFIADNFMLPKAFSSISLLLKREIPLLPSNTLFCYSTTMVISPELASTVLLLARGEAKEKDAFS